MNRVTHTSRALRANAHRGFTLTEMLVVIVILLILLGIGVTVGTSVIQEQEVQMTKEIVKHCELIAVEYQALTGAPPDANNIQQFVEATEVELSHMYKNFNEDIYHGGRIWDAWGKELKYSKDGRHNKAGGRDHNTFYCASAGPDDQWGDWNQSNKDHINYRRASDNIYSMAVGN